MSLADVTLGVALGEVDHKIREVGGNNRGPRIAQYLGSLDPPIHSAAPWCAAFVAYCSDTAARGAGLTNPLDEVKLEAYVQSYYDWASPHKLTSEPRRGDLVLFNFGGKRWDHIGIIAIPPNEHGILYSVEGNTGDVNQRDGDGVYLKPRDTSKLTCCFVRWAP